VDLAGSETETIYNKIGSSKPMKKTSKIKKYVSLTPKMSITPINMSRIQNDLKSSRNSFVKAFNSLSVSRNQAQGHYLNKK
jgi:hypothetical protein